MKLAATIIAAVGLTAFLPIKANAYGNFDVPAAYSASSWTSYGRLRPYTGYEPYRGGHHARAHHGPRQARRGHPGGSGNLAARSGARTSVSAVARPHFQCLVDRLEAAGYRVDFMGGYAARSGPSAHPTGNAVDINQTGRGRVTRAFPAGLEAMCAACGVYSGAHFGDLGHFEMLHKYGYVNVGLRYASYRARRWHHRHYASR